MNISSNLLVLGATGQVGKLVAANLKKRQVNLSVGTRRKANLEELADVGESLHGMPRAGTQTMKIQNYHTQDGAIHYGYAHIASLALIYLIAEANKRLDSQVTPEGARGIAEVYKTINALLAAGRRAGKLNILVKIAVLACLIVAASLARAEGQSIFIPSPPATSISTKTQGSPSSSVDLNQAAMSQIINQLNQRQFQLSVTAAQARTSAQRFVFVPQKITIKRAK
jgi:hypothetical protein